jgi:hypothetical protein
MSADYEKNSLSLPDAVAMGPGVMIGAGILALTGPWFPLAFLAGASVTAFSAYPYIKCRMPTPCGRHRDDPEKGLRADDGCRGRGRNPRTRGSALDLPVTGITVY